MVAAISLPGLTGPAPAAAHAPPGSGTADRHAAEGGAFAGVMAAAVDAVAVPVDALPAAGDGRVLDLAQLLAGLVSRDGQAETAASVIAGEVEHTLGQIRPDRVAGAERDEESTLREAYEALMAAWMIASPGTAPDGAAQALAAGSELATAQAAAVGLPVEFAGTAAGGRVALAGTSPGAGAFDVPAAVPAEVGLTTAIAQAAGVERASTSAATAVAATVTGTDASAPRADTAKAEQTSAKLDVTAFAADPERVPASAASTASAANAARGTDAAATDIERAAADAVARAMRGNAGETSAPERVGDEPRATQAGDRSTAAQLAVRTDLGTPPVVLEAAGADAPVQTARPAELVARLADTVQRATLAGNNELKLVLNPPELGHLTVRIQDTTQGVRIMIDASSAAARDLIQQHLPALHSALEARDLRVERLQVGHTDPSLGEQALNQNPGGSGFQGQSGEGEQQNRPVWSPVAAMGRGTTGGGTSTTASGDGAVTAATRTRPTANTRVGGVDRLA